MTSGYENVPDSEFGRCFRTHFDHFVQLNNIMKETMSEWIGCGSYLVAPPNWLDYNPKMIAKQELLFSTAKQMNATDTYFEVGVHGGHSLFIVLIANPSVKVTCVDICCWSHTKKCVDYLNTNFNNRITLIAGDSLKILPTICDGPYDVIHIDGDHSNYERVKSDIVQAYRLSKPNTTFIFDDYQDNVYRILQSMKDCYTISIVPDCSWTNCLAYRKDRGSV